MSEYDSYIKKVLAQPGVLGAIIMSLNGDLIYSTYTNEEAAQYSYRIAEILQKGKQLIAETTTKQNLRVLHIRSFKHEFVIIPGPKFALVTIQDSNTTSLN